MTKKKNNNGMYIMIGIVVAAIIIANNINFSQTYTTINQDTVNMLEQSASGECTIGLDKSMMDAGDLVTGSIEDGSNTLCSVYGDLDNTGWIKIGEGTTNFFGQLEITDTLNVPGSYAFRVICGECVSNTVNLVVNPIESSTCSDTDGIDKMTPGHVTADGLTYYDTCTNNVVTEYYCNGNSMNTRILPCDAGYECFSTRSGDYCAVVDNPIQDGDVFWSASGSGVTDFTGDSWDINLLGIEPGNCELKAYLSTSWNYVNEEACTGLQGMEGISWIFSDSDSVEYSRIDYTPKAMGVPIPCGLDYDGVHPFNLAQIRTIGLPDCEITYNWEVDVIACNCLQ